MHVELSGEVCCNAVTANKYVEISICSAEYYVPRPSTVKLKLKFQPSNRFMIEYPVSKITQKGYFLFHVQLYNKTFAVNMIRTYKIGFTAAG